MIRRGLIRPTARPTLARSLAWLLALAALSSATGCARVKPWERGTLAKRCMRFDADPDDAVLEQHTFAYREGAAGAYGGGGGGCGCN
ncbi:MAG: DUF4266 domain-containing protein [Myxococcales bacterium]|nr:DUF4266 domain-containing protein [Myxococcales bacterium]MCB9522479.1 DUF4266 domain-containing protein [Myxococcales bacterium]